MVLVYLGSLFLFFSTFIPTQGVTNQHLILISLGSLLVGLGEWKNHKYHSMIKPPNAYTGPAAFIQTKIRVPDKLGIILELLGVIFVVLGVVDLINSYFNFL